MLGDIEDAHAHIHRSVEDIWNVARSSSKMFALAKAGLAIRRLSLSSLLAKVFHRLSKDTVVHDLVEVLLKVAGSPFSELCVHSDVGFHPGALPEAEDPVNLRETHNQREVELQDTVIKHVTGLVAEVWYQLFNLSCRHPDIDASWTTMHMKLVDRRCAPCAAL